MERLLGLKIDVDTHQGMKEGVPRLLALLAAEKIRATFFLSIGPDASGRAVFQLLKNPRFLKKMVRTRAASLYGWRTALYGTLLPSPLIALSFPGLVKRIVEEGHEVQFHAWDHRRWQDGLLTYPERWIRDWFDRGISGFAALTGHNPSAFGAPAWLIDERVLAVARELAFAYLSCTRAKEPFIHEGTGLVELPSDLPCFEELGFEGTLQRVMERIDGGGIHVLPVHAEVEGGLWAEPFVLLLRALRKKGCAFLRLGEIILRLDKKALANRKFGMELLPGRSTACAT